MMTDPIADMLSRIRNAGRARHATTQVPASRLLRETMRVLNEAGFVGGMSDAVDEQGHPAITLEIKYGDDGEPLIDSIQRVSRPSRRVYVGKDEIPRVRNGLGMAVLSTSKGVLSDQAARDAQVGGEILCEVW